MPFETKILKPIPQPTSKQGNQSPIVAESFSPKLYKPLTPIQSSFCTTLLLTPQLYRPTVPSNASCERREAYNTAFWGASSFMQKHGKAQIGITQTGYGMSLQARGIHTEVNGLTPTAGSMHGGATVARQQVEGSQRKQVGTAQLIDGFHSRPVGF